MPTCKTKTVKKVDTTRTSHFTCFHMHREVVIWGFTIVKPYLADLHFRHRFKRAKLCRPRFLPPQTSVCRETHVCAGERHVLKVSVYSPLSNLVTSNWISGLVPVCTFRHLLHLTISSCSLSAVLGVAFRNCWWKPNINHIFAAS